MPIMPGGRSVPLTFQNRMHYVEQAVNFRLHEMDLQVSPVLAQLSALYTLPRLLLLLSACICYRLKLCEREWRGSFLYPCSLW